MRDSLFIPCMFYTFWGKLLACNFCFSDVIHAFNRSILWLIHLHYIIGSKSQTKVDCTINGYSSKSEQSDSFCQNLELEKIINFNHLLADLRELRT